MKLSLLTAVTRLHIRGGDELRTAHVFQEVSETQLMLVMWTEQIANGSHTLFSKTELPRVQNKIMCFKELQCSGGEIEL